MNPSPSSFDDVTENFADWVRLHATQVALGVGAVVVIVGGAALWRSSKASRAARAEAAFFQAQAAAAQGGPAAAQKQLEQVAQRYDGTAGGTEAQLALAQAQYDQGKYQDGLNVLKQANPPKGLDRSVRLLTAVGYEGLGKYADAAKIYEDAVKDATGASERAQLQADAARAYQAAGDKAAALKIWTELAALQAQGIADEARVRVGELAAKPIR
jgi:tetratricopeptide (TPR) repeat protein